ncbi:MAG: FAD-dependent urate hydroxylase [Chthoniobacter sp.]|jgi:thioredoxin reductase|nr:FAD-dependent urate hydroxylase [Chthoniobacter sp.]
MKSPSQSQVVIIGAGPYGLSAAAHLRAAKIETRVFGEAMEFWEKQMPAGMLLRSKWEASQVSDPQRKLRFDDYEAAQGVRVTRPIPVADFISYGRWFQRQAVPDLDRRWVVRVEPAAEGFRLTLDDGETIAASRVVVATGISQFAWRPPQFDGLPAALASHPAEHRDLSRFAGQRVAVIGGGQSALESAALLHESGAEVEVFARQLKIRWLDQKAKWLKSPLNPLRALLYPPTDVGPPILNQIVAAPDMFRRLPRTWQEKIAYRSTRPAGAGWLVERLREVPIRTSRSVGAVNRVGDRVELRLDDGTERLVDHVLISTGYRVDVSRTGFLAPALLQRLRIMDGYPDLTGGLESSSVPGLHFLGAPAFHSFGPLCRFVSGTGFAARALTRRIAGSRVAEPRATPLEDAPREPLAAE